jgi:hypothetical protein
MPSLRHEREVRMRKNSRLPAKMAMTLATFIAIGTALSVATAQPAATQADAAPTARPTAFAEVEGWQIGVWGRPGAHRWRVSSNGRGTIALNQHGATEQAFRLTVEEHHRFAGLIGRFTAGEQDASLCATDQAQDIVRWRGGTLGDGLFNFDHGCRGANNAARLALLTEALGILTAAAERQSAS